MTVIRSIILSIAVLFATFSIPAMGDAGEWIIPQPGSGELFVRSGVTQTNKEWSFIADAGLRIGLPHHLEVAAPLALTFAPLWQRRIEIAFTAGITDFWPADSSEFLYTPALVLSSRIHLSHEAASLTAIDYTHVQENTRRSPGFLRGATALMVDMGPYLTWCIGISYQKELIHRPLPDELPRSGFAYTQRVSMGSVRATPYSDVPLFSIHAGAHLDITVNAKIDIDTESTNARLAGGIVFIW